MSDATTTAQMTVGIDLGDRYSQVCVLDESGAVIEQGRLKTVPGAFRQRFEGCAASRIAIEAGTPHPGSRLC